MESSKQEEISHKTAEGSSFGQDEYMPRLFSLNGRIGRLQYLAYFIAVNTMAVLMLVLVIFILFGELLLVDKKRVESLNLTNIIFLYIPLIAYFFVLTRRRLHDLELSGWWLFLLFIPILNILFYLYLLSVPASEVPNSYGPRSSRRSSTMLLVALIGALMPLPGIIMAMAIPSYVNSVNINISNSEQAKKNLNVNYREESKMKSN